MKYWIIISASIFLMLVSNCTQKKESDVIKSEDKGILISVDFPILGTVEKNISFTGTLEGSEDILIYPDLPGQFIKYLKPEGSEVRKDEEIALLERQVPGLEFKPVPIKSTLTGILSHLAISEGQTVAPQIPIARVAKIKNLKIRVYVPEKYSNNVKKGNPVKIEHPLKQGEIINAFVDWVASFLDPMTHTREIRISLDNKDSSLRPGMFVKLNVIVARETNVLTVPYKAVLYKDTSYVYVVEKGLSKKKEVVVGLTDWRVAEIKAGLTNADSLIVVGQDIINDGQKIQLNKGVEK